MSRRDRSASILNLNLVANALVAAFSSSKRSVGIWWRTSLLGVSAILLPAIAGAQDAGEPKPPATTQAESNIQPDNSVIAMEGH